MAVFKWIPLNRPQLQKFPTGTPLLVVKLNGKGYYGMMSLVTADYLELTNGHHKHMIRFGEPASFCPVEPPRRQLPVMGDAKLI